MFGFITKRAHRAAGRVWAEELVTLTTARDSLAIQVDEQNRRIVSLESDLRAKNNRITNMQKDIDRLEAERDQHAAEVERMRPVVEKAERRRAQALANLKQNKAKAPLPEGVFEHGKGLAYTCKGCDQTVPLEIDLTEFDPNVAYCGGSPRCLS